MDVCRRDAASIGRWRYLRLHLDSPVPEEIDVAQFLHFKEGLVCQEEGTHPVLEVDFAPFNREFPRLRETRSIGQGVHLLNRHLAGVMFQRSAEGHQRLLDFLRAHSLEAFLERIPVISRILILSPHGYFAQSGAPMATWWRPGLHSASA